MQGESDQQTAVAEISGSNSALPLSLFGFGLGFSFCLAVAGTFASGSRVSGAEDGFEQHVSTVNPRKLEHGFRMIHAGIPYTLL